MKIINLTENSKVYTSNAYLVTGSWKAIDDINTLIDTGRDPKIIEKFYTVSTGVGKKPVEKIILTHNHYDHVELLPEIKKLFNPEVYAFSSSLKNVDYHLKDGENIKIGDNTFEVIHTPGHSSDSISLYGKEEKVLFCGDASLIIRSVGGTYENGFIMAMEKICRKDIHAIYFGHGAPMFKECNAAVRMSLKHIRMSMNLTTGKYIQV